MSNKVECYGCTCLSGYLMDTAGDRYDLGKLGNCVK